MRRNQRILRVHAIIFVLAMLSTPSFSQDESPLETLEPKPQHGLITQLLATFAGRLHYSEPELDDELSSKMFGRYLGMLDSTRMYFTQKDVEDFSQDYEKQLDDMIKTGSLDAGFDIANQLRQRMIERAAFAEAFINQADFPGADGARAEGLRTWAADEAELDRRWRTRIHRYASNLLEAGLALEEVRGLSESRFAGVRKYAAVIGSEDVVENWLNAFTSVLDPHSAYFVRRVHDMLDLQQEGVGLSVVLQEEFPVVSSVLPGGPADREGNIHVGDRIVTISESGSGVRLETFGARSMDMVIAMLRGRPGTSVDLWLLPQNGEVGKDEKKISLVRGEIAIASQSATARIMNLGNGNLTHRIGVIRLPAFYVDYAARMRGDEDFRSATLDVKAHIVALASKGIDSLLLDLRGNGGGALQEAQRLADLFLPEVPVVQVRATGGREEIIFAEDDDVAWQGPLLVLVDNMSAGSAEIFAAAMQDHGVGIVAGVRTHGLGTVQSLFNLNKHFKGELDLGRLKLTVGKYYRVNGEGFQRKGVTPDVELPRALREAAVREESKPHALPWDAIKPALRSLDRIDRAAIEQARQGMAEFDVLDEPVENGDSVLNKAAALLAAFAGAKGGAE